MQNDEDLQEQAVAKYMAILTDESDRNVRGPTDPDFRKSFGVCVYTRDLIGGCVFPICHVVEISNRVIEQIIESFITLERSSC